MCGISRRHFVVGPTTPWRPSLSAPNIRPAACCSVPHTHVMECTWYAARLDEVLCGCARILLVHTLKGLSTNTTFCNRCCGMAYMSLVGVSFCELPLACPVHLPLTVQACWSARSCLLAVAAAVACVSSSLTSAAGPPPRNALSTSSAL